jgi:D-glycero-alpha-D-manno-heptose 1-phosphate guanylyltransferase
MAEVNGRPFLEYVVRSLVEHGITDLIFCIGHLGKMVQDHFSDGRALGATVRYSVETDLLGTAGAVRQASPMIDGAFWVINGDSYVELDYAAMAGFHARRHRDNPKSLGTIAARQVEDASRFGRLKLAEAGRIDAFIEKSEPGPGLINAGVYLLEPAMLETIPPARAVSIEKETFPKALQSGARLYTFATKGYFMDIGTPEGYAEFCRHVRSRGL